MALARAHTVEGLIAGLCMDNKVEVKTSPEVEEMIMNLVAKDAMHRKTYTMHGLAIRELDSLMNENNIPYFIFKGTAVATHYRHPYQRTMGDVDFYIPSQDIQKAIRTIEDSWNVKVAVCDSEKHLSFNYKGILFELHYRVETFGSEKHQQLFDSMMDKVVNNTIFYDCDEGHARKLPPEEDLIVVFKHMFNHLLLEGVGLRQVVDVAVLMNSYVSKINKDSIRKHLKQLGYIRAFDATAAMLNDYLGLPCASLYAPLSDNDYRWGKRIMESVLESGNFGRSAYKNYSPGARRSVETAEHAFKHCFKLALLLPTDMPMFVIRRLAITFRKNFLKRH